MGTLPCWGGGLAVGAFIAFVIGHFVAKGLRHYLYESVGLVEPKGIVRLSGSIVGAIERFLFGALAYAAALYSPDKVIDLLTPGLVWVGLKMATHWQSAISVHGERDRKKGIPAARAMAAILSGAVSVTIGIIGGAVAAGISRSC